MALESLSAPIRSTPPVPPQTLRASGVEQTERRVEREPEPAASDETESGGAVATANSGTVANALRGAILDIVV